MAFAMITSLYDLYNKPRFNFPHLDLDIINKSPDADEFMMGWTAKKCDKVKNEIKNKGWEDT